MSSLVETRVRGSPAYISCVIESDLEKGIGFLETRAIQQPTRTHSKLDRVPRLSTELPEQAFNGRRSEAK